MHGVDLKAHRHFFTATGGLYMRTWEALRKWRVRTSRPQSEISALLAREQAETEHAEDVGELRTKPILLHGQQHYSDRSSHTSWKP